MAEALTKLKRESGLVVFQGDNHIISRHRNERDNLAMDWLRRHGG